jgi:radical SAM-linked protein
VTAEAGDLGNRDLVRAWEAAITAAGYAVSYSEGKRRSAKISLAAPLPLGVTSDCELVDVYLNSPADPDELLKAVNNHLVTGIQALAVQETGVDGPSLQSQLRWAEYEAVLAPDPARADEVRRRAEDLLACETLPSQYVRQNAVKSYDLRPLVLDITVEQRPEALAVRMRVRAEQDRTGRADQVLLALGIEAERITRTGMGLDETGAALRAYRLAGEPVGGGTQ